MSTRTPSEIVVAWIGTGVMGQSMAGHLQKAGYRLVDNRTKSKAERLIANGARWADSPGDAAAGADAIFTIVGFPKDVREVYLGAGGIVERAKPGAILCDMTTSEPSLAVEIAQAAEKKGLLALDAPVSGGDIGAREARLSIMVGGSEEAFQAAMPFFRLMGQSIALQGGPGAGQHTKMANQIVIASALVGVAEALHYIKRAGLDAEKVLQCIGGGAASSWTLSNLGPRMLKGDFEPGFYVRHFIKDMSIALAEAERMGLRTPGLALTRLLYDKVVEMGMEYKGTQALYLAMEDAPALETLRSE
ncbi:MAG: 2-hydroxy-3-oxopropionate reductase [candidate division BRC1 bacterium ADurb.BinA364]|nr:MAG: 2-hydroxy-3-oxopropionate reductase [candidate division BRC1 bacterium ADurb.BinA364]